MMAHSNKLDGHSLSPHARGSINPLGVGSIVRAHCPVCPSRVACARRRSAKGPLARNLRNKP